MIKRGDINDTTPQEKRDDTPPSPDADKPTDKQAADTIEDHASVRASQAVADASRQR